MNMKGRFLSGMLSLVTVFSLVPSPAVFAEENSSSVEVQQKTGQTDATGSLQSRINALPTVDAFKAMAGGTTVEGSNLNQKQMDVYNEAQSISDEYDKLSEEQQKQVDISRLKDLMNWFNGQTSETLTLDYSKVKASDLTFYSNGNIKSINMSYFCPSDLSPGTNNLVILEKDIGNGESLFNNYYRKWSTYQQSLDGIGGVVSASTTKYSSVPGQVVNCLYQFGENEIPITKNKIYYVYLWACWNGYYYPDAQLIKIKIQDGKAYYSGNGSYTEVKRNHYHDWKYTSSGNTVSVSCSSTEGTCEYKGVTKQLVLNTHDMAYNGLPYDGASVTNNITSVTDASAGEIEYYQGDTKLSSAPVSVGSYTAKVTIGGKTAESSFRITSASISPKVSLADWTYGDKAGVPAVTGNLDNGKVTYEYKKASAPDSDYREVTDFSGIPAGEYTLRANVAATANCGAGSATCSFKVSRSAVYATVSIDGWTYGDKANKPVVSGNPGGADVTFTYYRDYACTEKTGASDGASAEGKVPSNAGTYYVRADVAATENYESGYAVAEFTIAKKRAGLKWSDTDLVYNGRSQIPSVEVTGLVDGDECRAEVEGFGTDAGSYTARATGLDNQNYVLPEDATEHEFTIEPKKVTADITSEGGVYGTEIKPAEAVIDGVVEGETVNASIRYIGRTNSGEEYDSADVPTQSGNYSAEVSINDGNYVLTGKKSAEFDVERAEPTLDVSEKYDKNYGDESFKLDAVLMGDGSVKYESSDPDVAEVDEDGMVTLKKAGNATIRVYSTETDNYASIERKVDLTIKKVDHELTVTSEKFDVTYGDDPFEIGASLNDAETGLRYESSNENVVRVSEDGTVTPVGAGIATIKVIAEESENHNEVVKTVRIEVLPKTLGIEFGNDRFTYDGREHAPTATATGLVGNDQCSLAYTGAATDAGTYTMEVAGLSNQNYRLPEKGLTKDFVIERKKATVKVEDAVKHIGDADPEFSYKIAGLVGNDRLTGVKIMRESGEKAGSYALKAVYDENGNYDVETVDGKLTIEDHKAYVSSKAVDPTCTKAGHTEEVRCSVCGKVLKKSETVPALGHDWSGEWTVTKEATAKETGLREKTCPRDGQKKVEIIPAIGSADEKLGNLDKDTEIEPASPIREALLENTKESLLDSKLFSKKEREAVKSGKSARIWVEISKTDEDELTAQEKKDVLSEAEKFAGKGASVTYFDAELFRQIGSEEATQLHEPEETIRLSVKVPENLLNHDATVDRHYRIIRIHRDVKTGEGKVDTIDGKFSDGMLTFETDRFSTYAIAYNDVKPVSGVSVKGGDFTLTKKGETRKLEAEINPSDATNQNVTWTSSNESVAKVDENGNVTAVGNGEAEITVKTDDGNKTAKVRIKVEISEYKVSVPKTSGVKVTPVNGKDTVSNGGSFSFKLSYGKDYDGTDAVVKVNGKVVKPDAEGIYTVENVTEDLDITVENVKRNAPELDLSKASSGTVSNIPSGVEYRVKNAGEEEFGQWTKVSKDKLENLPSGDYEFRYVGEDGVESETVSVTVPDGNSNNSGSSNGNGSDVNKPSGNGNGTNSSVSGNAGNKSDNSSSDVNGSSNSSSRTEADASDKSAAAFANASSDKKADGKKKDGKSIPPMGEAKGHGMVLALAMIVMAAAVLSEELRRRRRN